MIEIYCLFYRKKTKQESRVVLNIFSRFLDLRGNLGDVTEKKEKPTRKLYETFITALKKLYKSFTKRF